MIKYAHNINMKYKIAISIIFITFFSVSAHSQEAPQEPKSFVTPNSFEFSDESFKAAPEAIDNINVDTFISDEPEITVVEDKYAGQYLEPNVNNLSKLYWKKNTLDVNNSKAIDNFLMINECDIYKEYYTDDFEWTRIRNAAQRMLKSTKDTFPDRFKFLLPVELGRYDLDRQGFPLGNDTAFIDLRRIEMGGGENDYEICGKSNEIEFYPRNIVLALSNPFNFDFIPVDEHIAQAFIIRRKYEKFRIPNTLRLKGFKRLAYARVRVHLTSYQGEARGRENDVLAVMFGKIVGIDIFEDAYETKLLKSINFED